MNCNESFGTSIKPDRLGHIYVRTALRAGTWPECRRHLDFTLAVTHQRGRNRVAVVANASSDGPRRSGQAGSSFGLSRAERRWIFPGDGHVVRGSRCGADSWHPQCDWRGPRRLDSMAHQSSHGPRAGKHSGTVAGILQGYEVRYRLSEPEKETRDLPDSARSMRPMRKNFSRRFLRSASRDFTNFGGTTRIIPTPMLKD